MKTFFKAIIVIAAVLQITFLTLFVISYNEKPEQSTISYETIQQINPDLIIDDYTLMSEELTAEALSELSFRIQHKRWFINTNMGLLINPNPKTLNVLIESGGGISSLSSVIIQNLNQLRRMGVKVNCYIDKAMSAAFYLAMVACDSRIALKGVSLMQHRSYYGSGTYTAATANLDLSMAIQEARALDVDLNDWLALTRTGVDKHFNIKEMVDYKLIHRHFDYVKGK